MLLQPRYGACKVWYWGLVTGTLIITSKDKEKRSERERVEGKTEGGRQKGQREKRERERRE